MTRQQIADLAAVHRNAALTEKALRSVLRAIERLLRAKR